MVIPNMDPLAWLRKHLEEADTDLLREMVATFVQALMDAEANVACGADYGERSPDRQNQRNGYREHRWDTRAGTIELRVPKLRTRELLPRLAPGAAPPREQGPREDTDSKCFASSQAFRPGSTEDSRRPTTATTLKAPGLPAWTILFRAQTAPRRMVVVPRASWCLLVLVVLGVGCDRVGEPLSPEVSPSLDPSPSPSPILPAPLSEITVGLQEVASLGEPVGMAVRSGDPALYFIEKTGTVVSLVEERIEVVLDLANEVTTGYEQGLLGIAFSPNGKFLYLNYTDKEGHTRVVEYRVRQAAPDPGSRREILTIEQPADVHNGGGMAFGPDGYLYIGVGDGGVLPIRDNPQSVQDFFGKILRIDPRPRGKKYRIPPDNPFADVEGAALEVWAYGLRNPWRFSFDRETGDLWIGDVGDTESEEINFQPASSSGGENYGWPRLEGSARRIGNEAEGAIPPIIEHPHGDRVGNAVIGGYVYRGTRIPELRGAYVYGDHFRPRLRAIRQRDGGVAERGRFDVGIEHLTSFGEDAEGELYAMSWQGKVYRIVARR